RKRRRTALLPDLPHQSTSPRAKRYNRPLWRSGKQPDRKGTGSRSLKRKLMPEFDDIRPYNDEEVRPTLDRLLHDNEFLDTIARLKLSSAGRYFAAVTRPLIRNRLAKEFT